MLIAVSIEAHIQLDAADAASSWVTHTHEVIEQMQQALLDIACAEVHYRDQRVIGDPGGRADYRQFVARARQELQAVHQMTVDNRVQQQRVDALAALFEQHFTQVAALMTDTPTGTPLAAGNRNQLAAQTQQMTTLAGVITAGEKHLLAQRAEDVAAQKQRAERELLAGDLLGLLLMIAGVWTLLQQHGGRVRAERERNSLERRFSAMAGHVDEYALIMLDESGHVISWNRGAERIKGYRAEEILGQHFSVFYPADAVDSGSYVRRLQAAIDAGEHVEEGWRIRKDGSRFWASATLVALKDEDGTLTGFAKITRDLTEQKRYEEGLREANETLEARVAERAAQWQATFHQGPIPIARFDLDGVLIEANPKWCQMMGCDEAQLKGINAKEFSPREDAAEAAHHMAQLLSGAKTVYTREKIFRRADGRRVLAQITVSLVRDRDNTPLHLIGAALDITERKRFEKALRASEATYRATVEHAPMGITHLGLDGKVLLANQALCDMFGYTMAELMALRPEQVIHPDDIPGDVEGATRLLKGEADMYRREKRHLCKDGSLCWTDVATTLLRDSAGQPKCFVALVQDITERKEAETALACSRRALEESEQRYKSLFAHNPDAVSSFDTQGRFLTANPSLIRMLGYTDEEWRSRPLLPMVYPDDQARAQAHFAAALAGTPQDYEIRLIRRDGRVLHVDVTAVPMIVSGQVTGVYVIAADISARKRAERQLQEALREKQDLIEHSPDIIGSVDQAGRYVQVNSAMQRLLGYSPAELIGRAYHFHVHPEDLARTEQTVARAIASNEVITGLENRQIARSGEIRHIMWSIRWSADGQALVCVGRDVTEAKRAEQALIHSEQRYRSTFEHAPVGIAHTDSDGNWIRVNQKLCEILGYGEGELLRMNFQLITHPLDLPEQLRQFSRLQAGEISAFSMEKRYFRKNGAIVWTDFTGSLVAEEGAAGKSVLAIVEDITERKQMEQALREAEESLRLIVDGATGYAMITLDPGGRILTWSSGAERILGYTEEMVARQMISLIFTPEDIDAHVWREELRQASREGRAECERWQVRRDGSRFYASGLTMALRRANGELRGYVKIFQDATERWAAEEENTYLANHDALTGLPNRTRYSNRLHEAIAAADRSRQRVAVLLLDLDRFKYINDTLGHDVGDLVLKEMAARLQGCVRETDTVARLGGDEFVIIQTQVTQPDAAGVLAQKVVKELSRPYQAGTQMIHSGASVGVTLYPDDARDSVELMKCADLAMYKAKNQGRYNYQFYTEDLRADMQSRKSLEAALRRALAEEEFFLLYQPQIDLATWQMSGVEALLRWNNPEQPMVTPDLFISLAEETGLIVPIGEWVMRAACLQGKAWQQAGLPTFRTAVNVSARQLRDPKFRKMIERVLDETGFDPASLEIEITEGLLLENSTANRSILSSLKDMGVRVAVDDFGTGFSALSYLKHFPIDVLKIDRSFTSHLPHNRHDTAIAASILNLAEDLGIRVIAEGVETAEQLAYLKQHNCTTAQGFLFSPPVAALDLSDMLSNGNWSRINPAGTLH